MASSARIDELRKKFDENPRRYFAPLANEFRKAGDLEQAVFICQEYLPQQPGHMSGHIVYGQALFELGRDEEAKAVFETALSLDPENLIALRHLGDIARQAGDLDVARFWYQRVLESDPRNEEISQVLMSLDAMRGEGAPPREAVSPSSEASALKAAEEQFEAAPEPARAAQAAFEGTEAVEPSEPPPIPAETPEAASYEPFEGFDRTIDFDEPAAATEERERAPVAEDVGEQAAVAETGVEERPEMDSETVHADADELLDLGDFSIGGATLDASDEATEPPPQVAASALGDLPMIELGENEASTVGDVLDIEAAAHDEAEPITSSLSFDETPFDEAALSGGEAAAATFEPEPAPEMRAAETTFEPEPAREPMIELASDMNLGLPSDEPALPTEFQPEVEPAEISAPTPTASTESVVGTGAEAELPGAAAEEVFVTETMANLYVEQGHLADALEIYDKLLAHNPSDARLQERARAVRERLYGKPHETVWEPEPPGADVAPAAAAPGPTIREFLRSVIARGANGATTDESTANEAEPRVEPEAAPRSATPSETVTGSIDALFANSTQSEDDRSAANALAQAFGEWPEPTPIGGVPAHEASSELSLDHVFKANAPVPRRDDADAFSFDQFFSDELGEGAASSEQGPERATAEGTDDIAQFNAWLNGLKKT